MNTQVIAVSNRSPKEDYYHFVEFKESLARLNVQPEILGMGEFWGGLMTKPRLIQKFIAENRHKSDRLIITDAWDILFTAHPDAVWEAKEVAAPNAVLFNAETTCFPRGDLIPQFPDPGTPYRFLNSGFMAGHANEILAILDSMNLNAIRDDTQEPDGSWFNPNDQEHYMLAYLKQPVPMVLDTKAQVCQSFSGGTLDQFELLSDGRVKNKLTGTVPLVWHFNGSSKNEIFPTLIKHLHA